jgi:hypothetical protein
MLDPETVSSQSPAVFQEAVLAEFHWAWPENVTLAVPVTDPEYGVPVLAALIVAAPLA